MSQADDKTVFLNLNGPDPASDLPASIRPVAASREVVSHRNMMYIAQQTSLADYTPGLNPLVDAAVPLLLTIVRLRKDGDLPAGSILVSQGGTRPGVKSDETLGMNIEDLRIRLEAEIRGFETQALGSETDNSQVLAARYLLCTAVDEAISTSKLGESGNWSKMALLSMFHNETWGGQKFFKILERCMQQPARNLYLLELMYLLLSLGFEGQYRVMDRGPIAIESLRDKIYRQVNLLRGEPVQDLSRKVDPNTEKSKIYAYIPIWLVCLVVALCAAVTLYGFSTVLEARTEPVLQRLDNISSRQEVQR